MKKLLFAFSAVALTAACSPKVTESITDSNEASMPSIAASGKLLYSKKCTKCHGLKVVDDYSKEKWANILPVMANKAELTEQELSEVSAYIDWELSN